MDSSLLDLRVARIARETASIRSFLLESPDERELPPFTAGAHVDVVTPCGSTRQYSLCNDPADRSHYLIAVLQEPDSRGGSRSMHEDVQVGATLCVSRPRNHFELADADHSVLVAGGIGITPLLCMAEHLSSTRASFELHYCARSRESAAFLERLLRSRYRDRVRCYFDDDASTARFDTASFLGKRAPGTHLYVCGPKGFIDYVEAISRRAGWPEPSIHREHFGANAARSGSQFEVMVASTRRTYLVPEGLSVTQVLNREGLRIPVSCEQGVCGTCLTRVLDGVPDHRDLYLSGEERQRNDAFLPCCSRARSEVLVLDL
jgi:vanillate O-demethylase ferredoxin subunit